MRVARSWRSPPSSWAAAVPSAAVCSSSLIALSLVYDRCTVFPGCTGQLCRNRWEAAGLPLAGGLQRQVVSMGRAYMFGMVGVLVLGTGCPGPAPPSMDAGDHD